MKGFKTLMHGERKVADCKFDKRGYLSSVSKVYDAKHLPPGVNMDNQNNVVALDLQRWILSRTMAMNRRDIAPLREFYGSETFISESGLSLFDSYWFTTDESLTWEKVNPYIHFNGRNDSVYLMLTKPEELMEIDYDSPNLTIPGRDQRLWFNIGGKMYLLNGNAQKAMADYKETAGDYVNRRRLAVINEHIFAAEEVEVNENVERVSFEPFYNLYADETKSKMENLKNTCEALGISDWKNFITVLCEYDKKTGNPGRELSEVYLLRNPKTLEIIKFANL